MEVLKLKIISKKEKITKIIKIKNEKKQQKKKMNLIMKYYENEYLENKLQLINKDTLNKYKKSMALDNYDEDMP